jgi:uncharacterized membrane protein
MSEVKTKPWWTSKTIWGAIITVLAVVLGFFGVQVDAETQALLVDNAVAAATAITALVGVVLSIYGRIKADTKIKR